jgi:RNA polymerase sigma factor (sigma-70 family)
MHDLSPEDLLSEAQIGFLDGVARFDPAACWQLTTYAIHRIRSTVQRAKANTGNAIRIPVGLREGGAKGAKALPGDNKRVMAMRAALGMCSLDAPIGDDDGGTLGDMTAGDDDTEATVADNEWNEETGAVLAEIMAALPEKFAGVLRRRADGETLDQVGAALGVSRERARQLEVEARARARRAAVDLGLADDEVLVEHAGKVVEAPEIRLSRNGCERCGHAGHFTKTCDKWATRRFGTWVVVRGAPCAKTAAGSPTGTQVVVRCIECNGEKIARAAHLERGIAAACECVQRKWRTQ